jgi:hypothetical protein
LGRYLYFIEKEKRCDERLAFKGWEMYQTYIQYFTICFALNSLTILLYLTPYINGYGFGERRTLKVVK